MNEAFEKILEQLEQRIAENTNENMTYKIPYFGLDIAKKIVKEVAEEYISDTNIGSNGWIPCSERLPEEYTVLCCDIYGEMIVGHPYFDEVSDTNYSAESDNEMMYNCVAWRSLPEPFKERD